MTCEAKINAGYRAENEGRAIRKWYERFNPATTFATEQVTTFRPTQITCEPTVDNSWIARISPTKIPY